MKPKKLNKLRTKMWEYIEEEYPNLKYEEKILYLDGLIDGYLMAREKYKKKK
jgi:hypothetical protein